MIGIIYFVAIIIANTLGAISGMGGGVLIKPIFDFIGVDSVAVISFYSSVAVFTMSLVSTTRQLQNGISFDKRNVTWLSLGALIGGIFGNQLLDEMLMSFSNDQHVKLVQISLTIITLLFALFYNNLDLKNLSLREVHWYFLCGLILGCLASLLGIGGGPINVSLLMLLFNLPIKQAGVYSIATILFSQLAKIITITIGSGLATFDMSRLLWIIPAAVIGGLLGARLSRILSEQKIQLVFNAMIILVIIINLYNAWSMKAV
ncbi:sulfite exporter TauE/SafE family protein [Vagococcus xieshaowenii]|uniref:Probable membrane transporter protein n=1 Tax=Vagococcus xieshaowenii TaxID=2562451 RepID=A0AAJ5EDS8_9ENTE|nr:sulfite exporter TauE/SafE family protein [Vagococcus xieshaowenii]QCA28606.1 sulfite exporter TauE/SafE family protein [Vagococcus xieshaowenii]TFZ40586.1 sulfite exporter TauE/SafE family protein [Vagococcus xieshaowenii]